MDRKIYATATLRVKLPSVPGVTLEQLHGVSAIDVSAHPSHAASFEDVEMTRCDASPDPSIAHAVLSLIVVADEDLDFSKIMEEARCRVSFNSEELDTELTGWEITDSK